MEKIKPLVIIPARGGSKGIPGKNIKKLRNKPLINYTLETARALIPDEYICVSTDSDAIIKVVEETGIKVPFKRPAYLATDTASSYEVLLHALQFYQGQGYCPDLIIFMQATSPFRNVRHLREALELYTPDCDMVVSVKETASNPYYVLFEEDENGWLKKSKDGSFTRRQDCPKVWEYNGAIYLINPKSLERQPLNEFTQIRKYVMEEQFSLDIDTPLEWKLAEIIAEDLYSQ